MTAVIESKLKLLNASTDEAQENLIIQYEQQNKLLEAKLQEQKDLVSSIDLALRQQTRQRVEVLDNMRFNYLKQIQQIADDSRKALVEVEQQALQTYQGQMTRIQQVEKTMIQSQQEQKTEVEQFMQLTATTITQIQARIDTKWTKLAELTQQYKALADRQMTELYTSRQQNLDAIQRFADQAKENFEQKQHELGDAQVALDKLVAEVRKLIEQNISERQTNQAVLTESMQGVLAGLQGVLGLAAKVLGV